MTSMTTKRGGNCGVGAANHKLLAENTLRESGEVLDIGSRGQLSAGGYAIGHETLIKDSLEKVSPANMQTRQQGGWKEACSAEWRYGERV